MNRERLLERLPPYTDKWVTVKKDHSVDDIITDILEKHKKFAPYYDRIAILFDDKAVEKICENVYWFCKKNIRYKEEKEADQTTALPTGILTRGYGDCKHYASFIGGILDGITRQTGKDIDWHYRFVSYNMEFGPAHHVFIVAYDKDNEYWIDPTPGSDKKTPYWQEDIYTDKIKTMPLRSNIGTVNQIGLLPILENVLADPEVQQAASDLAVSVVNMFTDLINSFVIGDQVPDYPIKSKNTYTKIITQIQAEFPQPNSITEAKAQYQQAVKQRDIMKAQAIAKGSASNPYPVDYTYYLIYADVANKLNASIYKYDNAVTVAEKKASGIPTTPPASKSSNMALYLGLAAAGFILLKPGKKVTGIGGIGASTLLLLGIGGFLLFKSFGSGSAEDKRASVKGRFAQDGGDVSFVDRMTDQEIDDVYQLLFVYLPSVDVPVKPIPEDLQIRLRAIGAKYNIFT